MKNILGYKITDKTLLNISSIEKNLAILNQSEISSKSQNRLNNEAIFDDLFAISSHLNLNLNLGDIKRISLGKDIEEKNARLLSNIRQVFDFVKNNYRNKDFNFNFHIVQHVVKLLQTNLLEVWDIGKIRTKDETTDKSFELESLIYSDTDLNNLIADAILWVETETNVHPIIKSVVFMMLINSNSPFVGLNYISSIILFRLVLEKYGYSSAFNLPLFKIFSIDQNNNLKKSIENALVKQEGITEVIEVSTSLLRNLIEQYKTDLVNFDYYDIRSNSDKVDLNERQIKLLKLLQQKVFIRRFEFVRLFKVSPMTAYRDLNYLVEKKLLSTSGSGKATTYSLTTR